MLTKNHPKFNKIHLTLLVLFIICFIWSGIEPFMRTPWILQSIPTILIVLGLILTYNRFQFSTFVYVMIFFHMLVLLLGAHYTYSENPLFNMLMERFDLKRNYFDRVGHFEQGFVPAFMIREIFIRLDYMKKNKALPWAVIGLCLGISALYELLEFAVSIIGNVPVEKIMANQGDPNDSYWDMIMALFGAILAVTIFKSLHNNAIKKLHSSVTFSKRSTKSKRDSF